MTRSKAGWRKIAKQWHKTALMCQDVAMQYQELADHRGESLGRVWIAIETVVAPGNPGMANELRQALAGDLLPGMTITYSESDTPETDDD